ncbi:hypothetical protein ACVQMG_004644 [Enterobacter roggenkampii]
MNHELQHPTPASAGTSIPAGITYRQHLVAQIAPVCMQHFLNDIDWKNYDEMAGAVMMVVDAIIDAERETSE